MNYNFEQISKITGKPIPVIKFQLGVPLNTLTIQELKILYGILRITDSHNSKVQEEVLKKLNELGIKELEKVSTATAQEALDLYKVLPRDSKGREEVVKKWSKFISTMQEAKDLHEATLSYPKVNKEALKKLASSCIKK